MNAYEIVKKTNTNVRVWKEGKVIFESQADWLRDIHDDELKALKVISLSIDKRTLVIGVK